MRSGARAFAAAAVAALVISVPGSRVAASPTIIPLNIVSVGWVGGGCATGEVGTLANLFDGDYSTTYVCAGFTSPATARIELRLAEPVTVGSIRVNSHSSWCFDGTAFISYWVTDDFAEYTRPGQVSIVEQDVWYSVPVNTELIQVRIYPAVNSACGSMIYAKEIELMSLNPYQSPFAWSDIDAQLDALFSTDLLGQGLAAWVAIAIGGMILVFTRRTFMGDWRGQDGEDSPGKAWGRKHGFDRDFFDVD